MTVRFRYLAILLLLIPLFALSQPAERACFSVPGGFYEEGFQLEIFPFYPQHHIRYTVNGNRPTAQSALYAGPLTLDASLYSPSNIYTVQNTVDDLWFVPDSIQHCIVIRAAVFDQNENCISDVATNSYFIQALGCDTHGLPVVSLCADSLDLFDYQTGIFVPGVHWNPDDPLWTGNYYETGLNWEMSVNVEFYETDNTGINQQAGLRTHGGNARRFVQKGMKLYAREEYGNHRFEHHFFEEIPQDHFKHLVLKPFSASWNQSGVTNHVCNKIAQNLNVESLADRPAIVFLNGEYWGIYFVQEKPDERYLQDHFGIDPDEVNILSGWNPIVDAGTSYYYDAFCAWLQNANLMDPAQWEVVKTKVDVNCFVDYIILELFLENMDWPANNMRCWQHHKGPWRWIFFDGDACLRYLAFDVFANAIYVGPETWPSSTDATLYFRKFLENDEFRKQFNTRFEELLNTVFQDTVTLDYLFDIKTVIEQEVPSQSFRFDYPESINQWNDDIGQHHWFLLKRVENMQQKLYDFWDLNPNNSLNHVFPNPFTNQLTLQCMVLSPKTTQLQIFNTLGQLVYTQPTNLEGGPNSISINVSLPAGVYVLKMDSFVVKLVRQ